MLAYNFQVEKNNMVYKYFKLGYLFSFIMVILNSCFSEPENYLNKISSKYIEEVGIDERSFLYISEYESDSVLRVFRLVPMILSENQELETSSQKRIKGTWVLYSLRDNKNIQLPSKIKNELINEANIIFDPIEWVILMCRCNNEYLLIRNSNYKSINELNEYSTFYKKCVCDSKN